MGKKVSENITTEYKTQCENCTSLVKRVLENKSRAKITGKLEKGHKRLVTVETFHQNMLHPSPN